MGIRLLKHLGVPCFDPGSPKSPEPGAVDRVCFVDLRKSGRGEIRRKRKDPWWSKKPVFNQNRSGQRLNMRRAGIRNAWMAFCLIAAAVVANGDLTKECERVRIIHVVDLPGCLKKPVPSVICQGHCSSFVQVSGKQPWKIERSCRCCQEDGNLESKVPLICPHHAIKVQHVKAKAAKSCMCRTCTEVEGKVVAGEMSLAPTDDSTFFSALTSK
ncbi:unnamed protein product [Notodromas monacha]|uniref:Bursicon n=1 Tax=Notodromas monacha TaxID=399045 RepID=A0A7R9BWV5_9CRUS|nr:unnamed protein product [Notodromas monacha]CAG0922296.1 unnamed protein product [Notodromas monacha]